MKGEGSSGGVTSSHIEEMMARAGLGNPDNIGDPVQDGGAGNARLHVQGQGIEGFEQGRVMTQRKFDRWQARLARREERQQERAARRALND